MAMRGEVDSRSAKRCSRANEGCMSVTIIGMLLFSREAWLALPAAAALPLSSGGMLGFYLWVLYRTRVDWMPG